jgi:hypothetical protein
VLPRDAIRKQFNGSLFYEYAAKMGKSMKEKKVRNHLVGWVSHGMLLERGRGCTRWLGVNHCLWAGYL